jgi:hypothetical protein
MFPMMYTTCIITCYSFVRMPQCTVLLLLLLLLFPRDCAGLSNGFFCVP